MARIWKSREGESPNDAARVAKTKDVVAEGLYIAAAATRLTLKNRMLVALISSDADFDVELFLPDAQEALLALAREAEADGKRAERERKRASRRFSLSDGTHDYRSRDVKNLRRRRKQSLRIAEELQQRAADEATLRELVEAAREAAWSEVSRNIDRRLRIEAARPDLEPDYEKMRKARMMSLKLVDLPKLAAHRKRLVDGEPEALPGGEIVSGAAPKASGIDLSELDE
ncbi:MULTISPECIES: hypothetical protein [Microbacterium]|uniref:Asparagine synthase n=2 Tax=Microbacterium ginsengisoli TaxID=400772 RepID=A0A0F0LXT2_9MICO|nr:MULTISPECIES: hypothetical protein [Microbacterium]KJL37105.1 hypothetical protein RR49_01217 [Microbacterium ginsengisoli]MCK9913356.1 asparagine synthase [Microbacteriaceae bacterium K1510]